jgi:hypothetical protein
MHTFNPLVRGPLMDPEPAPAGGGAFDPTKFRTDLLGDVGKLLKDQFKAFGGDLDKKYATKPTDPNPADPNPADPNPKPGDPATTALQKQLASLNQKLEASDKARVEAEKKAEEKERHSLIRGELGKFQFSKENGLDAAFRLLAADIKRNESGELVGPNDEPLGDYVSAKMNSDYDNLLAPKPVGGTGAGPGGKRGQRTYNLEDLKVGMKTEDLDAMRAHIANMAKEALLGN